MFRMHVHPLQHFTLFGPPHINLYIQKNVNDKRMNEKTNTKFNIIIRYINYIRMCCYCCVDLLCFCITNIYIYIYLLHVFVVL